MSYSISYSATALRRLDRLDAKTRWRIRAKLPPLPKTQKREIRIWTASRAWMAKGCASMVGELSSTWTTAPSRF